MVEIIACVLAAASVSVSVALARRMSLLERRVRDAEKALVASPVLALPETPGAYSIAGFRFAIAITQDHPQLAFANLLRQHLLAEDALADVMTPSELLAMRKTAPGSFDIMITGDVLCNGYAEVYYRAELTCATAAETICTLTQKPVNGDRPSNLVLELTTRLKSELGKVVERNERRSALRELRGP